jgi:chromobox protein 2
VEDLLARRTRRGKEEYLVKWKGFSDRHNTWEPAENLTNAPVMLARFQAREACSGMKSLPVRKAKRRGRR